MFVVLLVCTSDWKSRWKRRVKTRSRWPRGATWFYRRGVNRGHEGNDRKKYSPRWGRKFFLCQPLPNQTKKMMAAILENAQRDSVDSTDIPSTGSRHQACSGCMGDKYLISKECLESKEMNNGCHSVEICRMWSKLELLSQLWHSFTVVKRLLK